jgi:hypothetical protein
MRRFVDASRNPAMLKFVLSRLSQSCQFELNWQPGGRFEEAQREKILKIASRNRHTSTNIGVFPADTRKGLLEMVADCRRPTSQEISDGHYAFARRLNGLDRDLP